MVTINTNFLKLQSNYLFADIARKVADFKDSNPDSRVISLGIGSPDMPPSENTIQTLCDAARNPVGDVTRPLVPAVVEALHKAVDEMGDAAHFHGYGPEQGYDFLRDLIMEYDYKARGVSLSPDEIFVSDGAKSDVGNFQELFAQDSIVAVTDPVYPVYVDSNVMAGRAGELVNKQWNRLVYLPCVKANDFVPDFPKTRPDMIYLCYPNNPTGTVLNRAALQGWVDYARREGCVILFDSAYEAFIRDPDVPHSIYELEGAQEVAVEFRSFSKPAGFTGVRCGYTVVPKELTAATLEGERIPLNRMWNRRQCTKYNGCAYIVQRAAAAVYGQAGRSQIEGVIKGYQATPLCSARP